jgi:tetratricopeptide (TPR) repeat protein
MQLAALYESRKDYVRAIDRYRRVLAVASEHPMALNNIAYDLAVYQNNPKEALPYAERGYRLSKQAPAAADTLGWIYHELGDDSTATFYLEQALRGLPNHPDVLIHAATVHAALNDRPRARAELAAAGKLGAAVTSRDDFKTLRDQLSH